MVYSLLNFKNHFFSTVGFAQGVFFWLAGVGGDSQGCAANDGGGDVQRTTPGTLGSVGYHPDGRRVANVDDGGSSGGTAVVAAAGGRDYYLWLASLWEEGAKMRN